MFELPVHPLTGKTTFRYPDKVRVATWEYLSAKEEIVGAIQYDSDSDWIESVWRDIEKTPLAQFSDDFEWYRVLIRYFVLAEVVWTYHCFEDYETYEASEVLCSWVSEGALSKVKLAVICGEPYLDDQYVEDSGEAETMSHLLDQEHSRIIKIALTKFGDSQAMLKSLHDTFHQTEDDESEEGDLDVDDFTEVRLEENVVRLTVWSCNDFRRGE